MTKNSTKDKITNIFQLARIELLLIEKSEDRTKLKYDMHKTKELVRSIISEIGLVVFEEHFTTYNSKDIPVTGVKNVPKVNLLIKASEKHLEKLIVAKIRENGFTVYTNMLTQEAPEKNISRADLETAMRFN